MRTAGSLCPMVADSGVHAAEIVVRVGVMAVAVCVLAVVVLALKRRLLKDEAAADTVWTLKNLIALRDTGELTIEQYERLKAATSRRLTGGSRAVTSVVDDPPGPAPKPPASAENGQNDAGSL